MTPALIFGSINFSTTLAGYFKLIESVGGNVKKLLHQSFKSAQQNLEYASTASENMRMDYIRRALECFIDAVSVEENENLISSLVGLSMCQHLLGDDENSLRTFDRIKGVKLTLSERVKDFADQAMLISGVAFLGIMSKQEKMMAKILKSKYRGERFEEYKQQALATWAAKEDN